MAANERETNRVKAVELRMRGRALEDSIRGAAEALAVEVQGPQRRARGRSFDGHFPFEAALRAHMRAMEARFGTLVEDAPCAMVVADKDGKIALVNRLARELFGYAADEPVGASLSTIVSGPLIIEMETRGHEAALSAAGENARLGIELAGRRADGTSFPVEAVCNIVEGTDGPLVCMLLRDLGNRQAEHRRLVDLERRARLVLDGLPDAVVVANARGRITQINSAAESLFRIARDEVIGKAASRLLPETIVEQMNAALAAPFESPPGTFRATASRKGGGDFSVKVRLARVIDDKNKAVIAIFGEADPQPDDVASSSPPQGVHRLVAEASSVALLAILPDETIAYANSAAEVLFGFGAQELSGKPVRQIFPEWTAKLPAVQDGQQGDKRHAVDVTGSVELSGRRKGNDRFPVQMMVNPVRAGDDRVLVATLREITGERSAPTRTRPSARAAKFRGPMASEEPATAVPLADLTLDSIGDALVSMDVLGNVYFLNQAAEELTGWAWKDAAGRPIHEIVNVVDAGSRVTFRDIESGTGVRRVVQFNPNVALIRRDGRETPVEGSIAPIEGADGRPAGRVMIFRDVSLARARAQEVAHSAQHDALTGLPNRLLLNDRIASAISIAPRHQKRVAVMFLDLDGFKQINDTLGHATGDKLLRAVADRLLGCVRGSDTVSRIGGDEFVVLLSEVERAEDSAITARRMIEAVSEPYSIDQHELRITVSIGVSAYPDDGLDAETLIKNADAAMYQAKENGRHGYQFYKPAMNLRAVERQDVEDALRRALEREEFTLHFQPKVNLRTGEIAGAEALLRWEHPTKGPVSPALFVPVAEASGLIVPIGQWVMRQACKQVRGWQGAGLTVPSVAVNVSAVEFVAPRFIEGVFDILNETGLEPTALELELNEGALMKRTDATQAILEALAASGVQMSVDDFGTGYSNLNNLRRFPIHMLKVDQSFVREITLKKGEASVVAAVLSMAQMLSLKVIAEGVETADELSFLQQHQCDQAQGYYFSRPLPAEEFSQLLRTGLVSSMARRRYAQPFGRLHHHALDSSR